MPTVETVIWLETAIAWSNLKVSWQIGSETTGVLANECKPLVWF